MTRLPSLHHPTLINPLTEIHLNPIHRLHLEIVASETRMTVAMDGADVVQGLSCFPKTLPARYFYDDRGSHLFEDICHLPEYYLTRTERAILERYASDIVARVGACDLIELGSGSATKTQILFQAYGDRPLYYSPIDVSGGMLKQSALELLDRYPNLDIYGLVGTYEVALAHLPPQRSPQRMVIFLGSSLGNLDEKECDRLFGQIADALNPGDYFLLGVDLQKPIPVLEAAYNDRQGVTAAFNLNMLQHLNQRYGGNVCLDQFKHRALYNTSAHQIEMHLVSQCAQTIHFDTLDFSCTFQPQETIRTEISRKFDLTQLQNQLQQATSDRSPHHHLNPIQVWRDPQQWFALVLSQLQPLP